MTVINRILRISSIPFNYLDTKIAHLMVNGNISVHSRVNAYLSIQEENVGKSMSFVFDDWISQNFHFHIKITQRKKGKHAKEIE